MKQLLAFSLFFMLFNSLGARKILVRNMDELKKAHADAKPGDTVILKNGTWNNALIKLNFSGTAAQPIVFKAEKAGKVILSGISQLRIGGNYIIVDGLLFINGYAPSSSVIEFRTGSNELANHCRVTNTVINDFNKPKRMDDDYWVAFYGKHNRIDHCSFFNKKNMGVLLAVILDDDRSRENFHQIDHNYFGIRPPLGSNGGEIIRVGVSQHCEFNSNTQITDNLFEDCDGETEIVSIKSGRNIVSRNIFKECQGSVVLRHGDYNTVTDNLFLGNGKEATGGVRVINKGQWVINNYFYKCRGENFKAPLAIMNGIPNSPAHRYVQVTDAVIMNNSFVDCTPVSFGEGSDAERTLPPANVLFAKNIFYNTSDSFVYKVWDKLDGFRFIENKVSKHFTQALVPGFERTDFGITRTKTLLVVSAGRSSSRVGIDSLRKLDSSRLPHILPAAGFTNLRLLDQLQANAKTNCGARWFRLANAASLIRAVTCRTVADVYSALSQPGPVHIKLTASRYNFEKPLIINKQVKISAAKNNSIAFSTVQTLASLFLVRSGGNMWLDGLTAKMNTTLATAFIMSDSSAATEHFNLKISNCHFTGMEGISHLFFASKSTIADSIIIRNNSFQGLNNGFIMNEEKDDKGHYNAEKIVVELNRFQDGNGSLLNVYRGGNDESTLGPKLFFIGNAVSNYNTMDNDALIQLTGVQQSYILGNRISNSNQSKTLIRFKDIVRARHLLFNNHFQHSGSVEKNNWVAEKGNEISLSSIK